MTVSICFISEIKEFRGSNHKQAKVIKVRDETNAIYGSRSFTGNEFRFLSGKLNRRELLLFLTGRDPDAMNKVVGAFVHFYRNTKKKDKLND